MKTKRIGLILMTAGLIFIIAAALLIAYNYSCDQKAEHAAGQIMNTLKQQIAIPAPTEYHAVSPTDTPAMTPMAQAAQEQLAYADGTPYLGVLQIPSLGLTLPVQANYSKGGLKTAPCRYQGTIADGNLIIAAHNYASHFGMLRQLVSGDIVCLTDPTDTTYIYRVTDVLLLDGTAIEEMTVGDWDCTLFTCTLDSLRRVTIRCSLVRTQPAGN